MNTDNLRTKMSVSVMALSLGIFWSTAAAAQDDMAEDAPSDASIVVTAQRRASLLQDTPIAVTAITGDELRFRQIDQIAELTTAVPNVQIYDLSGGGVPVVVIRGVGLRNFRINDTPTTGIYVDDVYQANIAQLQATSFDLQRVEILKGPQGGLYGRNSVGGAIQYISKQPKIGGGFSGYADVTYGRFDEVTIEAGANLPLGGNLAARLSGRVVQSDDTYFRSVTGGFDHGAQDRWGVRGILAWEPADNILVSLKVHGGADNSELPLNRAVGGWEPSGPSPVAGVSLSGLRNVFCATLPAGGPREPGRCTLVNGATPLSLGIVGRYDSAGLGRNRLEMDWTGASLTLAADFRGISIKSITAYDELNYRRFTDLDAIPNVQQEIDYRTQLEVWSQELRFDVPVSEGINALFGFVLARDEVIENTGFAADDGLIPFLFRVNLIEQPYMQITDSHSGYARLDIDVTDKLALALELRHTIDDKLFEGGVFFPSRDSFVPPNGNAALFLEDSETFEATTWKAVVDYDFSDDIMGYVSIARGFKTGGFFGGFVTSAAQLVSYDNEFIIALEGGVKASLFNNRLIANAAVFQYWRSDVQQQGAELTPNGLSVDALRNIGDVRSTGVELDLLGRITPNFTVGGAFGWITSEIRGAEVVVASIFGGQNSPNGARLPHQPEFSSNLFARYERSIGSRWELTTQLEYVWQSNVDLELAVTQEEKNFLRESAYGIVNLQTSIAHADTGLSIGGFVRNLTGTEYRVVARDVTSRGFNEIWGAPRTWGITLGYSW
ncbi:TonB-dependent receptor [Erythrobacter sp. NFXS35]|uniref:TonB-dependent receptor n=1 Tax=Erythrobacter sp. NFXS35 TaxID=2818436 RepID=UPI0032DFD026